MTEAHGPEAALLRKCWEQCAEREGRLLRAVPGHGGAPRPVGGLMGRDPVSPA